MLSVLKKIFLWGVVAGAAAAVLFFVNQHKPQKPEVLPPPLPKKSVVSCFINGSPVFTGEILGEIKVDINRKISFFSLELNAEIQLLNGSCLVLEQP